MTDPMDTPPADHGSDRYDYVELRAPETVVPTGEWWDKIIERPCPDCNANVFATFLPEVIVNDDAVVLVSGQVWLTVDVAMADRQAWMIQYAHDDNCPTLAAIERQAAEPPRIDPEPLPTPSGVTIDLSAEAVEYLSKMGVPDDPGIDMQPWRDNNQPMEFGDIDPEAEIAQSLPPVVPMGEIQGGIVVDQTCVLTQCQADQPGTYTMLGRCANCDTAGIQVMFTRGHEMSRARCPVCGVASMVGRYYSVARSDSQ